MAIIFLQENRPCWTKLLFTMGDVNAKSGFVGAVDPLVNIPDKLLQMAVEIIDLPSYKIVDFSIAKL